jgi:tetratricopeptide (TPR) repeat protein
MFRTLGTHPGPDIGVYAAASLAALEPGQARGVLNELARAHLIVERSPGRYSMHDLLRAYALNLARTHDDDAEREQALRRVIDYYIHTAQIAERLHDQHFVPLLLDPPAPGTRPEPLADNPAAMAWFQLENTNLLAVQQVAAAQAWHSTIWQLAWTLSGYHIRRGYRHDRLAVWQSAVDAAKHLEDPRLQIRALRLLGIAYIGLDRPTEACEHLQSALALAEDLDDATEQARTHFQLARAHDGPDAVQALHHATCSLELYRAAGDDPAREARALGTVGWFTAQVGEYDTAEACCQDALVLHRGLHDLVGEAGTLDSLGYIAHHVGRHRDAVDYYLQAVDAFRSLGNMYGAADTLDRLGRTYLALGRHEQARASWRGALELYRDQGRDQDAKRVQGQLDTDGNTLDAKGS